MGRQPKSTDVYDTTEAGLAGILDAAVADEPAPTPRAAELVEEARHAGPLLPIPGAAPGLPTLSGGFGGGADLVGVAETATPGPTAEQSARSMIDLVCAMVPAGDWQPENDAEREELVLALQRVFEVRGFAFALPPELILMTVMGKYTRKRMKKPAVQKRLAPWFKKLPVLGKLMGAPAEDPDGGGAVEQPPPAPGPFDGMPRMTPRAE